MRKNRFFFLFYLYAEIRIKKDKNKLIIPESINAVKIIWLILIRSFFSKKILDKRRVAWFNPNLQKILKNVTNDIPSVRIPNVSLFV